MRSLPLFPCTTSISSITNKKRKKNFLTSSTWKCLKALCFHFFVSGVCIFETVKDNIKVTCLLTKTFLKKKWENTLNECYVEWATFDLSYSLILFCFALTITSHMLYRKTEAASGGVLWKEVFLKISQISQENTCVWVSF